jgi:hypothetical protein
MLHAATRRISRISTERAPQPVSLDYRRDGRMFHVDCRDGGGGINDLSAMRVVYLTFKTRPLWARLTFVLLTGAGLLRTDR